MNDITFTIEFKQLPFKPDAKQVIYVENIFDETINSYIQRNYKAIVDFFNCRGYDFCYIPALTHLLSDKEILDYYAPYGISGDIPQQSMMKSNYMLRWMTRPKNRMDITPSLLYSHPACIQYYKEGICQFRGIKLSPESNYDKFNNFANLLYLIENDIDDYKDHYIDASRDDHTDDYTDDHRDNRIDHYIDNYIDDYNSFPISIASEPLHIDIDVDDDVLFDEDAQILVKEMQERYEKLKQKGFKDFFIFNALRANEKVSRLRISKDLNFYLIDYNSKDKPLQINYIQKTLFILFLRHGEGIMMKRMIDYKSELEDIYKRFEVSEHKLEEVIKSLTGGESSSLRTHVSKIRGAFVALSNDHLANNYTIRGKNREPKKISLPRNLIECECDWVLQPYNPNI